MPSELEIRALGRQGHAALPAALSAGLRRARIPAAALESLPSAWIGERLLACPPLETANPCEGEVSMTAVFRPSYPLTAARFAGVNVVSNPQSPIYPR
jgi:hypothetical protein